MLRKRVFLLGATGTIGRATARALISRGFDVVCFIRPESTGRGAASADARVTTLAGATIRYGDVGDASSLARDGFHGERFDALVSCLASRTGTPKDAWAIDNQAHVHALTAAKAAGVTQVVLLSAICVQKPLLAFQHAKLGFEKVLMESGLTYSIVRATAFFKSLVRTDRAREERQAIPRLRQRHPHRLQADQRRRPRRLPGRLPRRHHAPQSCAADWRSRACHHAA